MFLCPVPKSKRSFPRNLSSRPRIRQFLIASTILYPRHIYLYLQNQGSPALQTALCQPQSVSRGLLHWPSAASPACQKSAWRRVPPAPTTPAAYKYILILLLDSHLFLRKKTASLRFIEEMLFFCFHANSCALSRAKLISTLPSQNRLFKPLFGLVFACNFQSCLTINYSKGKSGQKVNCFFEYNLEAFL